MSSPETMLANFNTAVPERFRELAADGTVISIELLDAFIESWGADKGFLLGLDVIHDNAWKAGKLQLPIVILNRFPRAAIKHASPNGDCSIHSILTLFSTNFRKLPQQGKDAFVVVCRTHIFPWIIYNKRGLFIKTTSVALSDLIGTVKRAAVWLGTDHIDKLFTLFGRNGGIWSPKIGREGQEQVANLALFENVDGPYYLIFADGGHYMPISNGAVWEFDAPTITAINAFWAPNLNPTCKYSVGTTVVYEEEEYFVIDSKVIAPAIVLPAGRVTDDAADAVVQFVKKGLNNYSRRVEIAGAYTVAQKQELKEMYSARAIDGIDKVCDKYILLRRLMAGFPPQAENARALKLAKAHVNRPMPETIRDRIITVSQIDEITLPEGASLRARPELTDDILNGYVAERARLVSVYDPAAETGLQSHIAALESEEVSNSNADKLDQLMGRTKADQTTAMKYLTKFKTVEKAVVELNKVQQFKEFTQADDATAEKYLTLARGNLERATARYFSEQGGGTRKRRTVTRTTRKNLKGRKINV